MRLLFAFLLLSFAWFPWSAAAHALDPAYLEITRFQPNHWRVTWRVPNVSGRPMPISVRLPVNCTGSEPPLPVFDGRAWISSWVVTCPGGLAAGTINIDGLERTSTEALVRYELLPGETQIQRLIPAETGFIVQERSGLAKTVGSYAALGVTHILAGYDHLLFVFALLLLVREGRRLFWAVTAFTLAHSMTLAAATLGWLKIPPSPVEAVIALSIVFLAFELTLPPEHPNLLVKRFPWIASFAFGLIHGLGFAGALREIGLPEGDVPLALLGFNLGVELGQILFIACVLGGGWAVFSLFPTLRRGSSGRVVAIGYAIGSAAAFLVISRMAAF